MKFRALLGVAGIALLSTTNAALAAAAPPPPPPAPLEAYGALPGVEDMAISPNGRGLAIIGEIKGQRMIVVVEDGKVRKNSLIGDAKTWSINWVGDELVQIILSSTQDLYGFTEAKHEFTGALMFPLDSRPPFQVFGKTRSLARAIFGNYGTRLIDGKWRGFFGGIELRQSPGRMDYVFDHGRPALFSVDLNENSPTRLARSPAESHYRSWLIDAAGAPAATLDFNEIDGRWDIVNPQGTKLAQGISPTGGVDFVSLGRDGTTVIYSREDPETQQQRWYEVSRAGGASTDFLPGIDIDRTYVDRTSGRLLGYLPAGDSAKPVLFDPAHQNVLRRVYGAFPNLDVSIRGWTPTFSHVLVSASGNGDSGTWYVVDLATRTADVVGNERPLIAPEQVGPISTVAYHAGDGLELDGILTLPPGREAKNLPVVMFPHGGPHAHDRVTFDWWAQAFASRGYAVFQPNFRGSTNRDDAFRRAGYGQWGRKMQSDISDGLAELAKHGIVDPKRACIVGASYGGYAALAGVTLQHGLYRCAVAVAPVSDLSDRYWTEIRESGQNKTVKRSMLESLGNPATFAEVSPRKHAAQADAPIMLIHGKDDTVVAFSQSTAMADALKDAGKPYELVVLREEDHWLSRAATRKQMLEATMRFVQQNNPAD